MPWRHILAGMVYFDASLLSAKLADGYYDAKKKIIVLVQKSVVQHD
jgi:lipopolysaccharide export system protein LptA